MPRRWVEHCLCQGRATELQIPCHQRLMRFYPPGHPPNRDRRPTRPIRRQFFPRPERPKDWRPGRRHRSCAGCRWMRSPNHCGTMPRSGQWPPPRRASRPTSHRSPTHRPGSHRPNSKRAPRPRLAPGLAGSRRCGPRPSKCCPPPVRRDRPQAVRPTRPAGRNRWRPSQPAGSRSPRRCPRRRPSQRRRSRQPDPMRKGFQGMPRRRPATPPHSHSPRMKRPPKDSGRAHPFLLDSRVRRRSDPSLANSGRRRSRKLSPERRATLSFR